MIDTSFLAMQKKKQNLSYPFVSFIIPTYNAQRFLRECLRSIRKQDYPKEKYEILVIDGGSLDDTKKIAGEFGLKVIHNPHRDPETGKSIGIQRSKGEIIALIDSDNEIIKKDWLKKMTRPLVEDSDLFGVESWYFPKKGESIFNTYSMLAHIADPFSRCLAGKLQQNLKKHYIEYTIKQNSTYPLGANGFLWNKRIIKKIGLYKPQFEESNFSYYAIHKGFRKFARVPGYGIYHHHIDSLGDFISKRLRIGNKFLKRTEEKRKTWLGGVTPFRFLLCILYCATFIGPFFEGLVNSIISRRIAWLLHPLMSFISVASYGVVLIKRKLTVKQ